MTDPQGKWERAIDHLREARELMDELSTGDMHGRNFTLAELYGPIIQSAIRAVEFHWDWTERTER